MATILELNKHARKILDELYFLDDEFEDEAERIEVLNAMLNEIYGSAENKINFVLGLLLEAQGKTEAAKTVEKQVVKKRKSCEAAEKRLKSWILGTMELNGLKKVTGDYSTVSYCEGRESVVVLDESLIPDELIKTEVIKTPMKREIADYIKEHGSIQGVIIKKEPFPLIR